MEQILFNAFREDKDQIQDAITAEINNPEYSKFLSVSKLKDDSISIKAKNIVVAKVKLQKNSPYIEIRTKNTAVFPKQLIGKCGDEWCRINVDGLDVVLSLKRELSILFMTVLSEMGGEYFGCCHRYKECSDEKKCVNPDIMMAMACYYKRNLEAGRIFYGKNKNI